MSFSAIMQAFNLPDNIKGNGRLVAIAIANRVNMHPEHDNQLCAWPSIKGLATDIGASKTAVKSSLNILEERGVITRIQRFSNGEKVNTLYIWHPWRTDGWDEAAMRRREDKERGYVREEAPQVRQEPQGRPIEPTSAPAPAAAEKPAQKAADGFDQWWPLYPKKVKKLDAQKAYRAALKAGATPQDLIAGIRKHVANWKAKGTAPQYIPYPATWLRAGSWEDEIDTPDMDSAPAPAINPATGKEVTKEDFWYACVDHDIDPNGIVNFWKPSMALPGTPGWPEVQAYLYRQVGRG